MSFEFANEPNNPCYSKDDEFFEEKHYCVINQKEFSESEMIYIASQKEWVCIDSIEDYLFLHYIHAEPNVYDKIKIEVDNILKKL